MPVETNSNFEDAYIWAPVLAVFALNVILYIIGQLLKDNGIVDITWGFTFVIPNAVVLVLNSNIDHRTILSNILLLIWAIRMALNNGLRHEGEDWRYAEMRENWMKKGKCFYYFAAYMFIYFTQSIFQLIMNSSALFISIWSTPQFYFLDALGACIWAFGFTFELVADLQL